MFNVFNRNSKIKIGDVVVCIDDRNWNSELTDMRLTFNEKII